MASTGRNRMKDIRQALRKQKFKVEPVDNGHLEVTNPRTGASWQISNTPSCYRGMLNTIQDLRREVDFIWKGR